MKQLTCEMCGSTDLMKQDGVFVCQTCGAKYSIEEAKKMMVEGTVDVSGSTVKIDNTSAIKNYLALANHAYDADNERESENYCNKIIEIDPTCSEAWLLKGLAAVWQSTLANNRMEEFLSCVVNAFNNAKSVDELNNCATRAYDGFHGIVLAINELEVNNVVSHSNEWRTCWNEYLQLPVQYATWQAQITLAYESAFDTFFEHKPEEERPEPEDIETELSVDDLYEECKEQVLNAGISIWSAALNDYISGNGAFPTDDMFDNMMREGTLAMLMLEHVIGQDTENASEYARENIIKACKNLIAMKLFWVELKSYQPYFSNGSVQYQLSKIVNLAGREKANHDIERYQNIIKKYDPSYEIPTAATPESESDPQPDSKPAPQSTGGCYIATAVYGSYDCPQVWTLRRYRDYTLAEAWYGRAFIRTYYAISPTLIKWFGHTEWFKKMWKGKLDRMVANLKASGVDDTPYEDKVW